MEYHHHLLEIHFHSLEVAVHFLFLRTERTKFVFKTSEISDNFAGARSHQISKDIKNLKNINEPQPIDNPASLHAASICEVYIEDPQAHWSVKPVAIPSFSFCHRVKPPKI